MRHTRIPNSNRRMLQPGHMLHPRSLFRNVHQSEEQLMKQMERQRHSRPSWKMMYIQIRIQCRNALGYFHTASS